MYSVERGEIVVGGTGLHLLDAENDVRDGGEQEQDDKHQAQDLADADIAELGNEIAEKPTLDAGDGHHQREDIKGNTLLRHRAEDDDAGDHHDDGSTKVLKADELEVLVAIGVQRLLHDIFKLHEVVVEKNFAPHAGLSLKILGILRLVAEIGHKPLQENQNHANDNGVMREIDLFHDTHSLGIKFHLDYLQTNRVE